MTSNDNVLTTKITEQQAEKRGCRDDLQPVNAVEALLEQMEHFPLIALGEVHQLQEFYDFLTTLLYHPLLPEKITDIVVEFGNAHYQEIADRFLLTDQPVAKADLQQIWRTASGNILWDAPVYEQFFVTMRAINWTLPPSRRLRVLLGDPPFDLYTYDFASPDEETVSAWFARDAHYVEVVEKEVMQKRRRALLIAGRYHLLRGLHTGLNSQELNAGTQLAQRYPHQLFVVDLLALSSQHPLVGRARLAEWPRRSLALLAGTWLGDVLRPTPLSMSRDASIYSKQTDAVLYLGPGELLTASRADPALYLAGDYVTQLQHFQQIADHLSLRFESSPMDLLAEGLKRARSGPTYFQKKL
ncbi:MAG: hypothetical protein JOZ18_13645 [Chloroflexi bacterium]|nr:hypothetical protein [Chloroflexota bacterium]